MAKWSPAHATVIKHCKQWLGYPIFHFDFSGGQMRNSLQHTGRCLGSPCPLTLFAQLNVAIVLLLHLKSLASAFDMIYWAGKPLSSCINLGSSTSPFAAPLQPPATCVAAEAWSIFHKIPSLACTHTVQTQSETVCINDYNIKMTLKWPLYGWRRKGSEQAIHKSSYQHG